jgi:hypothetical protein
LLPTVKAKEAKPRKPRSQGIRTGLPLCRSGAEEVGAHSGGDREPRPGRRATDALDFRLLMKKKSRKAARAPDPGVAPVSLPAESTSATQLPWWQSWKVMVALWLVMLGLVWLALSFKVDKAVIAGSVVVIGLVSNAFAWLLGIVALVPIIGPLIVKVLSIGFIWLLNAVGYLVSMVAIKRGYSRDVLTYRGVTVALIIGIVIGFVLGKLLQ